MAVADQQAAVAGDGQAQRSSAGVGDHLDGTAVGADPDDAAILDAGPDVAVGIGDDVFRGGAGHGDHVQGRGEVGCR